MSASTVSRATRPGPPATAGRRVPRVAPGTAAWLGLVALLGIAAAVLAAQMEGTTFWRDDWTWALHRRGNGLSTFLDPHYGHFSLVPILIYRALFATAGLSEHWPYRVLVLAAHFACVIALFVYARRRTDPLLALALATLLLFLGPAAQNILWPFQTAWLISLAAGIGAFIALDRDDRAGDIAAAALLCVSLASSGIGIPVAVGVVVDVLAARRRRRQRALVVLAVPLALFALWWVAYQTSQSQHWGEGVFLAPSFVAGAPVVVLSSLTGLAGPVTIDGPFGATPWGVPLLALALVAGVARLLALGRVPARVVALVAMLLSFWTVTALGRAYVGGPVAGRYIYVGAVGVLLLAAELLRGVSPRPTARALVVGATTAAVLSNVGAFQTAGVSLRQESAKVRAELATLDIARRLTPAGYVSQGFRFREIRAGAYFATERVLGTPADTPDQLAAEPDFARRMADAQLMRLHHVALRATRRVARAPAAPRVRVIGGSVRRMPGCVTVSPGSFQPYGTQVAVDVVLPPAGIAVSAHGGPAQVSVRRFAGDYGQGALGAVAAGSTAVLRIGPDRARRPWHARISATDRATVCALAPGARG